MTTWRKRWKSDKGGALMELALSLPLLIILFAGTADFARAFYTSMSLTDAARAGAQFGSYNAAQTGNFTGMQATAQAATSLTGVAANATRLCQCADDAGVFTPTATANDCVSPEATSCPGRHRVVTVTVQTSKVFNSILGGLPSFMRTLVITRSATMRAMQ